MTVAELLLLLSGQNPDATVILAGDRAGNKYSPCDKIDPTRYAAETTWRGEIDHPDEPFPPGKGVDAVVLWPVH